jgi:hypothetical protein
MIVFVFQMFALFIFFCFFFLFAVPEHSQLFCREMEPVKIKGIVDFVRIFQPLTLSLGSQDTHVTWSDSNDHEHVMSQIVARLARFAALSGDIADLVLPQLDRYQQRATQLKMLPMTSISSAFSIAVLSLSSTLSPEDCVSPVRTPPSCYSPTVSRAVIASEKRCSFHVVIEGSIGSGKSWTLLNLNQQITNFPDINCHQIPGREFSQRLFPLLFGHLSSSRLNEDDIASCMLHYAGFQNTAYAVSSVC